MNGDRFASLTPAERRVMVLLADGLAYKQIASELHVSYQTISKHICRIYAKTGIRTNVMVARLYERQLWEQKLSSVMTHG